MQLETFLKHWGLDENPFAAEEAREDPVFGKLIGSAESHPDFEKVMGRTDKPSSAVVFGEKGTGKTALRLMIEHKLDQQNRAREGGWAFVVRYDDLNPMLDRLAHAMGDRLSDDDLLDSVRLDDHIDAICSLATTRLVNEILGEAEGHVPGDPAKAIRKLPKRQRTDLVQLAMLYDQPRSGLVLDRWARLRKAARARRMPWGTIGNALGVLSVVAGVVLGGAVSLFGEPEPAEWAVAGAMVAAGVLLLGAGAWRWLKHWRLAGKLKRELRTIERTNQQLRAMLTDMPASTLVDHPLPTGVDSDARYQLMGRLVEVLAGLGYEAMIVLIDRMDEPTRIAGDAKRMRAAVWPMLNNKFLQQERVGIKLLLPAELRHLLRREDEQFYQRARLDKQHLIEQMRWSGTLLYDLCSRRIQACQKEGAEPIALNDWFDEAVTRRDLIDALDQMHQPRDAFKFIYRVVQEHCSGVTEDDPEYRIARLTLDYVRKDQSQRVQDFQRGISPA